LHRADQGEAAAEVVNLGAEQGVAFLQPVLVELADQGGEVEEAVGEGKEKQADRGEQQGGCGDFEGHGVVVVWMRAEGNRTVYWTATEAEMDRDF
jgi:hypothetical protein